MKRHAVVLAVVGVVFSVVGVVGVVMVLGVTRCVDVVGVPTHISPT